LEERVRREGAPFSRRSKQPLGTSADLVPKSPGRLERTGAGKRWIISDAHEAYRGARLHGQSPHGDIAARLREGVMTLRADATAAEPPSGEAPRRGKRALEV
jgi:hypothetical protein